MDTDAVRLFVRAAEQLNISAAGRALGLAPAVASAKLAKLEKALGADLLHRSTRKVALSLDGAAFLPHAREILAQEDAALAVLVRGQVQINGTLRFTAPSTFAQEYIAPILPEFLEAHPDLMLDLRLSDAQLDLIEGSFDLALRNASLEDTTLKGRRLAEDVRVLCAAPAYLDAHGRPDSAEDLRAHRFIAFRDLSPVELVNEAGAVTRFDPASGRCRAIMNDGQSHKRLTLAGGGISANALWSVHRELADGRLEQVLPDHRLADGSALWLLYPHATVLSAKVRVFMDFLLDRIGRHPPWRPR